MKNALLIITLALSLQGCFFVAGAAAGAAGVAIVYDHRKIEKILADEHITKIANDRLSQDVEVHDNTHVEVTCFNQVVLLTGEAPTPRLRQMAEHIVRGVPNIKRIYNQITIKPPTSTLTQASDSWITAKIKTQMLATKDLQSGTIKVVTENGIVYLMGTVNREQGEIAVDIARQVHGVQRVMKIFQYSS
jgi:osmotically-inducible protein OsmY